MNNKEIKLINGQIITTSLFIITLVVSIIIAYNEKLMKQNKEPFFTIKEALNIALINRICVIILGSYFVYDAYKRRDLNNDNKSEGFNFTNSQKVDNTSNLQILSSWIALISSLIILYIIIQNYRNTNFDSLKTKEI